MPNLERIAQIRCGQRSGQQTPVARMTTNDPGQETSRGRVTPARKGMDDCIVRVIGNIEM
jgi:hypothetical protein